MTFLSKFGNIVRLASSKQINAEFSSSMPSLFQAIQCMSSSKLFVGGIAYGADDSSLREAFSKYGEVIEGANTSNKRLNSSLCLKYRVPAEYVVARVILDLESDRSRGFGFVTYNSSEEASSAIQALDGQDLHDCRIRVNYAADRSHGSFGGGGYGGGGGNGGSGGYGGSGVYGGGGYEGSGNFGGSPGGNFGGNNGNVSGRTYGSRGTYGDNTGADTYGSGGNFGSYGSNPGQNVGYSSPGSTGTFDTAAGNFGIAGDDCGGDNFASCGFGGGIDGVVGVGSRNLSEAAGEFNQDDSLESNLKDEPLEANYRDEDNDTYDFAKRA